MPFPHTQSEGSRQLQPTQTNKFMYLNKQDPVYDYCQNTTPLLPNMVSENLVSIFIEIERLIDIFIESVGTDKTRTRNFRLDMMVL